jgi:hypothetical protein
MRHIAKGGILHFKKGARTYTARARRALMSGDETETLGPPKTFRILRPEWQSDALATFFWRLDEIDRRNWREPVVTRSTQGNAPRARLPPSGGKRVVSRAPGGLWRNCYHPQFLESLESWQLDELDMIDEDYDFSIDPNDT